MKWKIVKFVVLPIVMFLSLWAASAALNLVLMNAEFSIAIFCEALLQQDVLQIAGALWLISIILIIVFVRPRLKTNVVNDNDLENSHFMTATDIKKAKALRRVKYSELAKCRNGLPLAVGKKVILADPGHAIVIGTNGSGKTTAEIGPTIQVMAQTLDKPSFIITDPKGELFATHSQHLKNCGYDIQHIDLGAGIFESSRWNPFDIVYNKIQRVIALKEQDEQANLQEIKRTRADAYQDMQDIIYTCFPIASDNKDPFWESGARDFVFAVALAFCEDVENCYMEREQFNLYNLNQIIVNNTAEECKGLKEFFAFRGLTSKAAQMSKQVLDTSGSQLSSYITTVHNHIKSISDLGIETLTSGNDIKFDTFDEKPSALFIRIPHERDTRHKIAVVLVQTAFKQLVAKAAQNARNGKTEEEKLLRDVFLMLEEFGNLPKMPMIDKVITVGRALRIWFFGVIQDYAQLFNVYGNNLANIIKSNCNIKVFIGSTDKATIEEISKLCGQRKTAISGYSENHKDETSTSVSVRERPLIYASELEKLNRKGNYGNAIILFFGHPPLRTKFVPTFKDKSELYTLGGIKDYVGNSTEFDETAVIYTAQFRVEVEKREKQLFTREQKSGVRQKDSSKEKMEKQLNKLRGHISDEKLDEVRNSENIVLALESLLVETKQTTTKMNIQDVIDILKGDELCKE